jgi:RimJ/RimL family protein N-acetyltransferase
MAQSWVLSTYAGPRRIVWNLAMCLGAPGGGQGLMTEALIEIVQWGLRQQHVFRIGGVCDVDNIGSARVTEKSGLAREGLLRRWLTHPNISHEPRDCSATLAYGSEGRCGRR